MTDFAIYVCFSKYKIQVNWAILFELFSKEEL